MSTEEIVIALLAVLVGALLKSISGLGLPLVTIPVISWTTGLEAAVAITALPNLAQNLALTWQARDAWPETRDLPVLAATGFVGAIVGTVVLVSVPEEPLILLLVAVVIAYTVLHFRSPNFAVEPSTARRLAPGVGLVSGALQGAVGISGPVVASWIHSYRLPRNAYILSVTLLFAFAGLAQVPTLAFGDTMTGRWTVSIIAVVPALATIPFGTSLRNRLSNEAFDRFVVLTLAAAVIGLAIRTFT